MTCEIVTISVTGVFGHERLQPFKYCCQFLTIDSALEYVCVIQPLSMVVAELNATCL